MGVFLGEREGEIGWMDGSMDSWLLLAKRCAVKIE